jgi:hypothetical protein
VICEQLPDGGFSYFRPVSFVRLGDLTGDFLARAPAEEVKTVLTLLSFLTPNGDAFATPQQVAARLSIPQHKAAARLERLLTTQYHELPLGSKTVTESGMILYRPGTHLVERIEMPPPAPPERPPIIAAGRDAVIAHSREHYARPRAEVEAEIARIYQGDIPEESTERAELRARLVTVGFTQAEATAFLNGHPEETIRQQLDWLPYRGAKSPVRYLMAAVEHNYAMPRILSASSNEPTEVSEEEVPDEQG